MLRFSHHVLHEERHLGIFCLISLIKKESSDNMARATPYSAESQKLRKSTKHNATNRVPPTRPWVQSLRNFPDDAPLRSYQVQVDKHMAEVEGEGSGACRARFLGVEEGEFSDRRIHHASRRIPKQGTLCHKEDGAYNIRSPQRRPF